MERVKALALYDKLLATNPEVQRKGDTLPYPYVSSLRPKATTKRKPAAATKRPRKWLTRLSDES